MKKIYLPFNIKKWRKLSKVIIERYNNLIKPEISIVLPFFNQQLIIDEIITSIIEHTSMDFEIILIDDNSTDESSNIVISNIDKYFESTKKLSRILLIRNDVQFFETYCDSLGIQNAKSQYILEIQADMLINHKGYDDKLLSALRSDPKFIAISGRGCHTLETVRLEYENSSGSASTRLVSPIIFLIQSYIYSIYQIFIQRLYYVREGDFKKNTQNSDHEKISASNSNIFPERNIFLKHPQAGRLAESIFKQVGEDAMKLDKIWISETVMRGPLLIDKKKYNEVGGFACEYFFLGYDDHYLMHKAYENFGYICGFTPIRFTNLKNVGSTRKTRSFFTSLFLYQHLKRISRRRNEINFQTKSIYLPDVSNF